MYTISPRLLGNGQGYHVGDGKTEERQDPARDWEIVVAYLIGIGFFLIFVGALLLLTHYETRPTRPDAMSEGIFIYAADEGVDLEWWVRELPHLVALYDRLGAYHDLWPPGRAAHLLEGTALVLHKDVWVDHWGRKVAGLATYRKGIEIVDTRPIRNTALAREWFLMLTCDMGGDEDYEAVLEPTKVKRFFMDFHIEADHYLSILCNELDVIV